MKQILILASNPKGTSVLDLDREIRDIREGLRRSQNRDEFIIETRGAVRPKDLWRAMLEVKPQIVHFCGHGMGSQGLVLENDDGNERPATTEALSELFRIFSDRVECVLLNACYSEVQANAIVDHINYVIGMNREVRDDAAIAFTVGFYDALGAGESIERAFDIGKNAVLFEISDRRSHIRKLEVVDFNENPGTIKIQEHLIPVLKKKKSLTSIEPPPSPSLDDLQAKPKQTDTWSYLRSLKGHSDWIRSLAFSPDGEAIVSGSNDETARLWDVKTGQLIHILTGHKQRVKSVGISRDGTIVSASANSIIKLWSLQTGELQGIIKTTDNPATVLNVIVISPLLSL
ncbi:MAG: CHAT domain-containing protein [Nostoc sp. DedQUE12a]|nr:CHAT domain-containing protein [Nostoc sp. DedQUE12a]